MPVAQLRFPLHRLSLTLKTRWDVGRPTVVHLIPRPGAPPGARPRRFELPPSFVFHHANAYEQGEHVIIDSVHYDSLPGVGTPALGKKQAQKAQRQGESVGT